MVSHTDNGSAARSVSGWLPVVLAAAATVWLAAYLATGPHEPAMTVEDGLARRDEGAAARIWQLLMMGQIPLIFYFAAVWLPKERKGALRMLALQGLAFVAAALPVVLLDV